LRHGIAHDLLKSVRPKRPVIGGTKQPPTRRHQRRRGGRQFSIIAIGLKGASLFGRGKRWRIQDHRVPSPTASGESSEPVQHVANKKFVFIRRQAVGAEIFPAPVQVVAGEVHARGEGARFRRRHRESAGIGKGVEQRFAAQVHLQEPPPVLALIHEQTRGQSFAEADEKRQPILAHRKSGFRFAANTARDGAFLSGANLLVNWPVETLVQGSVHRFGLPLRQQPARIRVHNQPGKSVGGVAQQSKSIGVFIKNQFPKLAGRRQRVAGHKRCRHRRLQCQRRLRLRVFDAESVGVQHQSWRGRAAVARVAKNRESIVSGVSADLVCFTGERARPHQEGAAVWLKKLELGFRVGRARDEPLSPRSLRRQQEILFAHLPRFELPTQRLVGLSVLSEKQYTGGLFVESVNY